MKRTILLLALCGCPTEPPDHDFRSSDDCEPTLVLRFARVDDGWTTEITIIEPDCSGSGMVWHSDQRECDVVADAVRDACEELPRSRGRGER
jgi:hypothetical protein